MWINTIIYLIILIWGLSLNCTARKLTKKIIELEKFKEEVENIIKNKKEEEK